MSLIALSTIRNSLLFFYCAKLRWRSFREHKAWKACPRSCKSSWDTFLSILLIRAPERNFLWSTCLWEWLILKKPGFLKPCQSSGRYMENHYWKVRECVVFILSTSKQSECFSKRSAISKLSKDFSLLRQWFYPSTFKNIKEGQTIWVTQIQDGESPRKPDSSMLWQTFEAGHHLFHVPTY